MTLAARLVEDLEHQLYEAANWNVLQVQRAGSTMDLSSIPAAATTLLRL
jgi:hypothetical protein